jgi:hypothetical protein
LADGCHPQVESLVTYAALQAVGRRAAQPRESYGHHLDYRRDIRVRYVAPKAEPAKVVRLDDYQHL